jgi:hypothetical protein
MLRSCQEGTGYGYNKSGVRGEFSIRPSLPVYTRDARGSAMMSVLKAALGVSEIVGLTCESGLAIRSIDKNSRKERSALPSLFLF